MNRTGLVIALAVAVVVGLIFGIWPDLDLKLAGLFFDPDRRGFWRSDDPTYLRLRNASTWLIALIALPAVRRARASSSCRRAGRWSFPAAPSC